MSPNMALKALMALTFSLFPLASLAENACSAAAGSYCNNGTPTLCPAGYYCTDGEKVACRTDGPMYYCLPGGFEPMDCPMSTNCDGKHSVQCPIKRVRCQQPNAPYSCLLFYNETCTTGQARTPPQLSLKQFGTHAANFQGFSVYQSGNSLLLYNISTTAVNDPVTGLVKYYDHLTVAIFDLYEVYMVGKEYVYMGTRQFDSPWTADTWSRPKNIEVRSFFGTSSSTFFLIAYTYNGPNAKGLYTSGGSLFLVGPSDDGTSVNVAYKAIAVLDDGVRAGMTMSAGGKGVALGTTYGDEPGPSYMFYTVVRKDLVTVLSILDLASIQEGVSKFSPAVELQLAEEGVLVDLGTTYNPQQLNAYQGIPLTGVLRNASELNGTYVFYTYQLQRKSEGTSWVLTNTELIPALSAAAFSGAIVNASSYQRLSGSNVLYAYGCDAGKYVVQAYAMAPGPASPGYSMTATFTGPFTCSGSYTPIIGAYMDDDLSVIVLVQPDSVAKTARIYVHGEWRAVNDAASESNIVSTYDTTIDVGSVGTASTIVARGASYARGSYGGTFLAVNHGQAYFILLNSDASVTEQVALFADTDGVTRVATQQAGAFTPNRVWLGTERIMSVGSDADGKPILTVGSPALGELHSYPLDGYTGPVSNLQMSSVDYAWSVSEPNYFFPTMGVITNNNGSIITVTLNSSLACNDGFVCQPLGDTLVSYGCPKGFICNGGSAKACEINEICPVMSSKPQTCPRYSYCENQVVYDCPPGWYCPGDGFRQRCPVGTVCTGKNEVADPCPTPGYFCTGYDAYPCPNNEGSCQEPVGAIKTYIPVSGLELSSALFRYAPASYFPNNQATGIVVNNVAIGYSLSFFKRAYTGVNPSGSVNQTLMNGTAIFQLTSVDTATRLPRPSRIKYVNVTNTPGYSGDLAAVFEGSDPVITPYVASGVVLFVVEVYASSATAKAGILLFRYDVATNDLTWSMLPQAEFPIASEAAVTFLEGVGKLVYVRNSIIYWYDINTNVWTSSPGHTDGAWDPLKSPGLPDKTNTLSILAIGASPQNSNTLLVYAEGFVTAARRMLLATGLQQRFVAYDTSAGTATSSEVGYQAWLSSTGSTVSTPIVTFGTQRGSFRFDSLYLSRYDCLTSGSFAVYAYPLQSGKAIFSRQFAPPAAVGTCASSRVSDMHVELSTSSLFIFFQQYGNGTTAIDVIALGSTRAPEAIVTRYWVDGDVSLASFSGSPTLVLPDRAIFAYSGSSRDKFIAIGANFLDNYNFPTGTIVAGSQWAPRGFGSIVGVSTSIDSSVSPAALNYKVNSIDLTYGTSTVIYSSTIPTSQVSERLAAYSDPTGLGSSVLALPSGSPLLFSVVGTTCPTGFLCDGTFSQPCPYGFTCNGNVQTACTGTQYCPLGSSAPTSCPAHQYCENGILYDCPEGRTCPSGSLGNTCPVDKYSPTNSQVCYDLPTGLYTVEGRPFMCPSGYYCTKGVRTPCPAGSYCPMKSSAPIVCPYGTFCPAGSHHPTICPKDHYCSKNFSEPKSCGPRTISPLGTPHKSMCVDSGILSSAVAIVILTVFGSGVLLWLTSSTARADLSEMKKMEERKIISAVPDESRVRKVAFYRAFVISLLVMITIAVDWANLWHIQGITCTVKPRKLVTDPALPGLVMHYRGRISRESSRRRFRDYYRNFHSCPDVTCVTSEDGIARCHNQGFISSGATVASLPYDTPIDSWASVMGCLFYRNLPVLQPFTGGLGLDFLSFNYTMAYKFRGAVICPSGDAPGLPITKNAIRYAAGSSGDPFNSNAEWQTSLNGDLTSITVYKSPDNYTGPIYRRQYTYVPYETRKNDTTVATDVKQAVYIDPGAQVAAVIDLQMLGIVVQVNFDPNSNYTLTAERIFGEQAPKRQAGSNNFMKPVKRAAFIFFWVILAKEVAKMLLFTLFMNFTGTSEHPVLYYVSYHFFTPFIILFGSRLFVEDLYLHPRNASAQHYVNIVTENVPVLVISIITFTYQKTALTNIVATSVFFSALSMLYWLLLKLRATFIKAERELRRSKKDKPDVMYKNIFGNLNPQKAVDVWRDEMFVEAFRIFKAQLRTINSRLHGIAEDPEEGLPVMGEERKHKSEDKTKVVSGSDRDQGQAQPRTAAVAEPGPVAPPAPSGQASSPTPDAAAAAAAAAADEAGPSGSSSASPPAASSPRANGTASKSD